MVSDAYATDKAVVMVDGGYYDNVSWYLRDTKDEKLDLHKLSLHLCDYFDTKLLRTKFYHSMPYRSNNPTEEQEKRYRRKQSFFDTLDNLPKCQFEEKGRVKQGHADCPSCGEHFTTPSQKGVDVGIAVDLVEMAYQNPADAFILISGDEDLKHAVRAAKERLVNVYLAFSADSSHDLYVSSELSKEVDSAINMDPDFLLQAKQD
jgi:uncharacterized LabA/DUF88 family protein